MLQSRLSCSLSQWHSWAPKTFLLLCWILCSLDPFYVLFLDLLPCFGGIFFKELPKEKCMEDVWVQQETEATQ